MNAKLAVLSDLVSGYGEIFLAQEFFIGIDILRGVKMWQSEGFVNVGSISRFCECDCVLYRSGVILCCVRGGFPWRFKGGGDGLRSGL